MCGCERHHDMASPCTCTCPDHAEIRAEQERGQREWQPGDVALIRVGSEYEPEVGIWSGLKWYVAGPRYGSQHGWYDEGVTVVRPLLVIDPEDREQVKRLDAAFDEALTEARRYEGPEDCMQTALRSLLPKPKPCVWAHVAVEQPSGLYKSLCGKVWKPAAPDEVTVEGNCPGCREIVEGRWIS